MRHSLSILSHTHSLATDLGSYSLIILIQYSQQVTHWWRSDTLIEEWRIDPCEWLIDSMSDALSMSDSLINEFLIGSVISESLVHPWEWLVDSMGDALIHEWLVNIELLIDRVISESLIHPWEWLVHQWVTHWWMSDSLLILSHTHNYANDSESGKWLVICRTCLIPLWVMTHSFVGHDPFLCMTWLMGNDSWFVGHASFLCRTCLVALWDMTHSFVGHDSFLCMTWLISLWDMTHSFVWHDS